MLVLDTDHLTELGYRTGPGLRLETKLHQTKQDTGITAHFAKAPGLRFENGLG